MSALRRRALLPAWVYRRRQHGYRNPAKEKSVARADQTLMFAEAAQAGLALAAQRDAFPGLLAPVIARLRAADPAVLVTCARGSSDHAASFAKYVFELRGLGPVASHAPSITSIYGAAFPGGARAALFGVSQSGKSPDLVAAMTAAREAGAVTLALVNAPDSPLAAAAEMAVPLLAGPEHSIAATKSCLAAMAALARLAAMWREDADLLTALNAGPEMLAAAFDLDWSAALAVLAPARSLYIVGRGLTFSAAQEAALKLKETAGLHAEAVSAAELRHGPAAIAADGMPVLIFAPTDAAGAGIPALIDDLAARGAQVISIGLDHPNALYLPTLPHIHSALTPLAQLTSFYRYAAELSVRRGFDPDKPAGLHKVTETR
jgi:glucosamine--fructose-6-phosphate aminotransferase (isomerizing)